MPKKWDKQGKLLPGFQVRPEVKQMIEERKEKRTESQLAFEIKRRMKASGFEFDKFIKYVKRFTSRQSSG